MPGVLGAVPTPVPLPVIYEVFERLRSAAERGDVETLFDVMRIMLPNFRAGLEQSEDCDQRQPHNKHYGRRSRASKFPKRLAAFHEHA